MTKKKTTENISHQQTHKMTSNGANIGQGLHSMQGRLDPWNNMASQILLSMTLEVPKSCQCAFSSLQVCRTQPAPHPLVLALNHWPL